MTLMLTAEWPLKRLEDLAERVDYGHTASANSSPVGPQFLRITDIQDDHVDWSTVPFCECDPDSLSILELRPGDVVFARTGATTGKSFLLRTCPPNAIFASYLIRVRTKLQLVDPIYLARFFQSPQYWAQISKTSVGTAQPGVNASKLRELLVPLPPIEEQRRIAAILDKADVIRRKRQEAIALTEQILRSTFLEMFGDPVGHGWPMTTVGDLVDHTNGSIRTGPFGSDLRHSEFVDTGVAVLGIDNAVENNFSWGKPRFITPEKYNDLRRYTVFPGDVIITIMGTCGRCAIVPHDIQPAINTKHLCCITLDKARCLPEFLHSYFLFHWTALAYLERTAKGAIMAGLNLGIIKALPVPVVPMVLQRRYQAFASALACTRRRQREQASNAEALFTSLVQCAFTGQL